MQVHQDLGEQRLKNRESLTSFVVTKSLHLLASRSCPKKLKEILCSIPLYRTISKAQTPNTACQVWGRAGGSVLRAFSLARDNQTLHLHVCLSPSQLSDWWLKTAYLEYRLPVVVHSSPGVVLPKQDFLDRQGQLR